MKEETHMLWRLSGRGRCSDVREGVWPRREKSRMNHNTIRSAVAPEKKEKEPIVPTQYISSCHATNTTDVNMEWMVMNMDRFFAPTIQLGTYLGEDKYVLPPNCRAIFSSTYLIVSAFTSTYLIVSAFTFTCLIVSAFTSTYLIVSAIFSTYLIVSAFTSTYLIVSASFSSTYLIVSAFFSSTYLIVSTSFTSTYLIVSASFSSTYLIVSAFFTSTT
ncbi:hypothetical protein Pcinc_026067 [Petrolisthes cinctipes]|uniref:Uncharacterized protein n=1 Tax=Petrolisthes cinctipes TaxID=88211 RepID=A0AAE1F796_PETCI|nr:hypothetical protein Pcinc_026067 [Petrolisthes cinctipes]